MTNQPIASLPKGHQTMVLAHRAMVRDLDRIASSADGLTRSADPARAAALRDYSDKIYQVIEHHHEGEDTFLWPRLRELGADESALALMVTEHEELSEVLHAWHRACERLDTDSEAAAEVAKRTAEVRDHLSRHTADEEQELLGRLAPALGDRLWKQYGTHMRKTAPGWTLRFMPAWLASVAGPEDKGGVPAPPVALLFRGWLQKTQQAAFGEAS
ncbi:hemerythrin domain-containing protein [Streptomyces sp. NPDC021622]|uniref:hemerythrin domain-containing protein n=1 Tax=Streptomyces sp. NPDC021622 TaxID=3155013 RepID=UPI0033C17963